MVSLLLSSHLPSEWPHPLLGHASWAEACRGSAKWGFQEICLGRDGMCVLCPLSSPSAPRLSPQGEAGQHTPWALPVFPHFPPAPIIPQGSWQQGCMGHRAAERHRCLVGWATSAPLLPEVTQDLWDPSRPDPATTHPHDLGGRVLNSVRAQGVLRAPGQGLFGGEGSSPSL